MSKSEVENLRKNISENLHLIRDEKDWYYKLNITLTPEEKALLLFVLDRQVTKQ